MSVGNVKFAFVLQFDGIGGSDQMLVSHDEYEKFKTSPIKLIAIKLGVSVDDYLRWVEVQGYIRCIAINKNKTQCKNTTSLRFYNCSDWVEANKNGGYCSIHGGTA